MPNSRVHGLHVVISGLLRCMTPDVLSEQDIHGVYYEVHSVSST